MQHVAVLGATGSIGQQTLQVLGAHPEQFNVFALSINTSVETFIPLVQRYQPSVIGIACPEAARRFQDLYPECRAQLLMGADAATQIAAMTEVQTVVAGIVGSAGLPSVLAAARAGKRILFANKEVIVMLGQILFDAMAPGAVLLPVDSEHNALFQCMPKDYWIGQPLPADIDKLYITCSGGPFLKYTEAELEQVTPAMAISHPIWSMGPKISLDSATLMNKALEVIEAHWLFGAPASSIDVLIHPQSVVHSLVKYRDGSLLAQLGVPDMRTPIAHCLSWPEQRISAGVESLDFTKLSLSFEKADLNRFKALELAYQVLASQGLAACVFNAANEVAGEVFLQGQIPFKAILATCEQALEKFGASSGRALDEVIALDGLVRQWTRSILKSSLVS